MSVPGLIYVPNAITPEMETTLINLIDDSEWDNSLRRRTQHYGWRYDYTDRGVREPAAPIPSEFLEAIGYDDVDQIIVNEYQPGQGISTHIDRTDAFGGSIVVLSLLSTVPMVFALGDQQNTAWLERRSIAIMTMEARYEWTHCIPARKSDEKDGVRVARQRRVSITYRQLRN